MLMPYLDHLCLKICGFLTATHNAHWPELNAIVIKLVEQHNEMKVTLNRM